MNISDVLLGRRITKCDKEDAAQIPDPKIPLFNYRVFFSDGGKMDIKQVAISSHSCGSRTTFVNEDGYTMFVFPDSSIKYIAVDEDGETG